MSAHLSSEVLDLLMLSALPDVEADAAKQHLGACAVCTGKWEALQSDAQRFSQFVFPRTVEKVVERTKGSFFSRFKLTVLVPLAGLAAAFAVVAATGGGQTEDDLYVGVKGDPTLEVYASRAGGGAFAVTNDVALKPEDRIRFVVNPAGGKYLLVVSRDGAGAISVYYPFGEQKSALVASNTKSELPGSVELDGTLGNERLFAIFSNEPVNASTVESALKAGDALQLPGTRVVEKVFTKAAP